jgi:hypothetical protein
MFWSAPDPIRQLLRCSGYRRRGRRMLWSASYPYRASLVLRLFLPFVSRFCAFGLADSEWCGEIAVSDRRHIWQL